MTACVDNKTKKGGAAKAVSATLAGVLAVGMVPAAAFAAEGDQAPAEGDSAELLVNTTQAFAKAEVVSVVDNAGETIEPEADGSIVLPFTGGNRYITAVNLKLADGKDTSLTVSSNDEGYSFAYHKDPSSANQPIAWNAIADQDTYSLTITNETDGQYDGQSKTFNFEVKAEATDPALEIRMATEISGSAVSAATENLVYGGYQADDAIDGTADLGELVVYKNGESVSATISAIYKADNLTAGSAINLAADKTLYAGDYIAVARVDSETVNIPFTVAPLDLSTVTVLANATDESAKIQAVPTVGSAEGEYQIVGMNASSLIGHGVELVYAGTTPQNQIGSTSYGSYAFKLQVDESAVAAKPELAKSIKGSKEFNIDFVKTLVDITYNGLGTVGTNGLGSGTNWNAYYSSYTVGGNKVFSTNLVYFCKTGTSAQIPAGLGKVTVLDASGKEVDSSVWTTTPGTYTVIAKVNDSSFTYGGAASATFKVSRAIAQTAQIYVYYDGELSNGSITKTYDGKNAIDDIEVKVVNSYNQTLVEGTDYELVYTSDTDKDGSVDSGEPEVDSIVNAGKYTLTVKPLTFSFNDSSNTAAITVNALKPTALRVADEVTVNNETGLAYTGAAITPVVQYTTAAKDASGKIPEDATWTDLPTEVFTPAYTYSKTESGTYKAADEVNAAGYYKIDIAPTAVPETANYDYTDVDDASGNVTVSFQVIEGKRFVDVPADAWYAEYVDQAATNGYIFGYNHGNVFGPNNAITRGDVCMVLARMAGVPLTADDSEGSATTYYETPFSDVDGNLYYAEAIAWAANAGIVNGYQGTDEFRPDANVSRQEFVTMLARYAEIAGTYEAADTTAELAKYSDSSSVATWADDAIAWASAEGIMNGYGSTGLLMPGYAVSRAEVAKMAIVCQPDQLDAPLQQPAAQ